MPNKLKFISETDQEIHCGFQGIFRCQTKNAVSWNYNGQELFQRIPCSNCEQNFNTEDLKQGNYELWTDSKFAWIDKKFNAYWDRYLIDYQVSDFPDKDGKTRSRKFPDGKQLILKACFVITKIIHKKCFND